MCYILYYYAYLLAHKCACALCAQCARLRICRRCLCFRVLCAARGRCGAVRCCVALPACSVYQPLKSAPLLGFARAHPPRQRVRILRRCVCAGLRRFVRGARASPWLGRGGGGTYPPPGAGSCATGWGDAGKSFHSGPGCLQKILRKYAGLRAPIKQLLYIFVIIPCDFCIFSV